VPFEVPDSWEWVKLCDITSVIGDGLHGTPQYDIAGDYFFINGNNLLNRHILIKDDTKKVSIEEYDKYKKPLNDTTILVSINGTIGNVGIFKDEKVILGKSACYFNIFPFLIKEYICSVIESQYFLKYALSSATGSTIKNVPLQAINEFLVPIPPIAEQKRIIVAIDQCLSIVEDLENEKNDLSKNIQQSKAKILDLAIHGKLVPQDPNDEPAIELLKRINPSFVPCDNGHSGKMPEGWIYCNLKDVANIQDNKRCPIKTEERNKRSKGKSILYPYYGATGIAGYIDDFLLDGKYILLGEDGAPFLDKYAKKAYETKGKIWVNNHVHILEPQINFSYLLHYLNTVDYSYYVKGTTRLKLTQSDMSSIKVLLPPLSEQQRIATKIEEIFAVLNEIQKSIED